MQKISTMIVGDIDNFIKNINEIKSAYTFTKHDLDIVDDVFAYFLDNYFQSNILRFIKYVTESSKNKTEKNIFEEITETIVYKILSSSNAPKIEYLNKRAEFIYNAKIIIMMVIISIVGKPNYYLSPTDISNIFNKLLVKDFNYDSILKHYTPMQSITILTLLCDYGIVSEKHPHQFFIKNGHETTNNPHLEYPEFLTFYTSEISELIPSINCRLKRLKRLKKERINYTPTFRYLDIYTNRLETENFDSLEFYSSVKKLLKYAAKNLKTFTNCKVSIDPNNNHADYLKKWEQTAADLYDQISDFIIQVNEKRDTPSAHISDFIFGHNLNYNSDKSKIFVNFPKLEEIYIKKMDNPNLNLSSGKPFKI